jgi:hypothetical protein
MGDRSDETRNTVSGGTQRIVLQGRDFRNIHIGDIIQAEAPVVLAQLPAVVDGFVGRDSELAQIIALLNPAENTETVVVSALAGLAGVGKTALAIQACHATRQAGWFSGGTLFIDLHGYDDAPVQPSQALEALLRGLKINAGRIPPGTEERAGLYRSALASTSEPVLIIADNASSEAQVRPLLPGFGPHRVMITSRHTLAGLSARLLDISALDDMAGVALLDRALRAARPGDDRVANDRRGASILAQMCGGLPLALQIMAAQLKADPSWTVTEMVGELGHEMNRLEALKYNDGNGTSAPSVAAAFELSYRQLSKTAAQVLRLMPVSPSRDVSTDEIVALTNRSVNDVRKALRELIGAHLIDVTVGTNGQWGMHDLLFLYAQQLSEAHASADGREQARNRLQLYYLTMSEIASAQLDLCGMNSYRDRVRKIRDTAHLSL